MDSPQQTKQAFCASKVNQMRFSLKWVDENTMQAKDERFKLMARFTRHGIKYELINEFNECIYIENQ